MTAEHARLGPEATVEVEALPPRDAYAALRSAQSFPLHLSPVALLFVVGVSTVILGLRADLPAAVAWGGLLVYAAWSRARLLRSSLEILRLREATSARARLDAHGVEVQSSDHLLAAEWSAVQEVWATPRAHVLVLSDQTVIGLARDSDDAAGPILAGRGRPSRREASRVRAAVALAVVLVSLVLPSFLPRWAVGPRLSEVPMLRLICR